MKSNRKSHSFQYEKRVYPIVLHLETEGGYTVEIKELPGCITQGETLEEALEMIEDAKNAWITINLELGNPIPLPSTEHEFGATGGGI